MALVLQGVTSFIVNKDLIFKPGTERLGVKLQDSTEHLRMSKQFYHCGILSHSCLRCVWNVEISGWFGPI